jgi:lipid-A-disaccharide synthase
MGTARLGQAGVDIVCDYRHISVTGLGEIVSKLPRIMKAFRLLRNHFQSSRPSLLILVDYPGFNLRLAAAAARAGIPVVYFIPPQLWAWNEGRIRKIRENVQRVLSILPFEEAFFRERGVDASYVGHPFVGTVKPTTSKEDFFSTLGLPPNRPVVTVMPGSRDHEIKRHTPAMMQVTDILRERLGPISILLPLADSIDEATIKPLLSPGADVHILRGQTYDALAHSDLALVASGSATLEAALLGTPSIVMYRLSRFSYMIGRMVVKVPFVSLPNLIARKMVFPEYIQRFPLHDIANKAVHMLKDGREAMSDDIAAIRTRLGSHDSYTIAGDEIVDLLRTIYGPLPETP